MSGSVDTATQFEEFKDDTGEAAAAKPLVALARRIFLRLPSRAKTDKQERGRETPCEM